MIQINEEKCIGCGKCVQECFPGALTLVEGKAKYMVPQCMECGHCIAVCPKNALTMEGYDMSQVLELKDIHADIDPETYLNQMKARRSIRKFKNVAVTEEQIQKILEVGRFSPTGSNMQNVRYHVFSEKTGELRDLLMDELLALDTSKGSSPMYQLLGNLARDYKENGRDRLFFDAPLVIAVTSPSPQAALLAAAHMETMIYALGLGMLYSGFTNFAMVQSEKIRNYMQFKEGYQPWAVLVIGVPDVQYERTVPRKPLDVSWN